MTLTVAELEPTQITAGDRVQWTKALPDYLPAAGWALSYVFVSKDRKITVSATTSGTGYAVDTSDWLPGVYEWQAYVTRTVDPDPEERYTVARGRVEILPDLAAVPDGYDPRTFAQEMVDAIEAALRSKATRKQLDLISYATKDRTQQRDPVALIKLRDKFKWEVHNQQGKPRFIHTRFGR